jgi:DUF438 domain-containing protein
MTAICQSARENLAHSDGHSVPVSGGSRAVRHVHFFAGEPRRFAMNDGAHRSENDRRPAETARQLVLEQHLQLRRMLSMGLLQARQSAADGGAQEPLRDLVSLIRDVFVQHLADEEALIVPILEEDLPVGPSRVEALREEHDRQRSELETLCAWPEEGSDRELAARFETLATTLLGDIAHEERELLIPDVIRDDHVVINQLGG